MNMSYRRAWLLVDVMNRSFQKPLVHSVAGGRQGGGASVTDLGRQVLVQYRALEQAALTAAQARRSQRPSATPSAVRCRHGENIQTSDNPRARRRHDHARRPLLH
ncbi:MAG: hypothetical protein ABIV04_01980, partial [Massilia sp.]